MMMSKDESLIKKLGDLSPTRAIAEVTKAAIKNVAHSKDQKKSK